MYETVEERLEDLERLALKQAERITELELQLESLMRLARYFARRRDTDQSQAA